MSITLLIITTAIASTGLAIFITLAKNPGIILRPRVDIPPSPNFLFERHCKDAQLIRISSSQVFWLQVMGAVLFGSVSIIAMIVIVASTPIPAYLVGSLCAISMVVATHGSVHLLIMKWANDYRLHLNCSFSALLGCTASLMNMNTPAMALYKAFFDLNKGEFQLFLGLLRLPPHDEFAWHDFCGQVYSTAIFYEIRELANAAMQIKHIEDYHDTRLAQKVLKEEAARCLVKIPARQRGMWIVDTMRIVHQTETTKQEALTSMS